MVRSYDALTPGAGQAGNDERRKILTPLEADSKRQYIRRNSGQGLCGGVELDGFTSLERALRGVPAGLI